MASDEREATAAELETDVGRLRLFLWACIWGQTDEEEARIVDYFEKLGWIERTDHGFKATPAAPKDGE